LKWNEFRIFVIPTILGEGKRLFSDNYEKSLALKDAKSYKSGAVLLHYEKQ